MKYTISILLILLTGYQTVRSQFLTIRNVNVVDVKSGEIKRNVNVVIEQNRIKRVSQTGGSYKGKVVDGTGKYLIPGLWDMHTHNWNSEQFFPMMLANGVTGIRDMFGQMANINKWRKEIAEGRLDGPVIFASGPIVDGPKPVWPGSIAIGNPVQVHSVLDSMKNILHVDFIKVYSLMPRDVYFKLAEEAKKQNIPFAGHIPNEITVLEAAKSGQKSQEHLLGFIQDASDSASYMMKVAQRIIIDTTFRDRTTRLRMQLRTFNSKKLSTLISELTKHDTWICPTLTVNRSIGHLMDTAFINDPRIQYMMPGIKQMWNPANDFRFKTLPPEYYELNQKIFALQLNVVKQLNHAGIRLLAGTDFPNPYCFPGFSLHDELQLMVEAGLSPLQALQTATINPALFLDITKDYGTIEESRIANLVLLDKNPLENIQYTKRIQGVVINGKYLGKQQISQMLSDLRHN